MGDVQVLRSGMRASSLEWVRAHGASLPRPVVAFFPDGVVSLEDGRHRVAVALERGARWIDVDCVVYSRTMRVALRFERRLTVR